MLAIDEDLFATLRILGRCVIPARQLLRTRRQQLELSEVTVRIGRSATYLSLYVVATSVLSVCNWGATPVTSTVCVFDPIFT